MAGLAFTQLLKPGVPMILGTFAGSMSMQSGAPTFGTPEPALITRSPPSATACGVVQCPSSVWLRPKPRALASGSA